MSNYNERTGSELTMERARQYRSNGQYEEAFRIYQVLAEQGNVDAQVNLASCYDFGRGVAEDCSQAAYWYRRAAEQGDFEAQHQIGTCYYFGRGVQEDREQAAKWIYKAADRGYTDSEFVLGLLYLRGLGVEENHLYAQGWFYKAALKGHKDAQYFLGGCYERGLALRKMIGRPHGGTAGPPRKGTRTPSIAWECATMKDAASRKTL